jgi:DNA-binding transcriptional regulator YiaG
MKTKERAPMTISRYQYTESGLDNIWLGNGFDYVDGPGGRHVIIKNIDGLHEAIGKMLVGSKKNLSGKEFRFLRHEMLMSQASLGKLLGVSEQAIHRWEKGKTGQVPKPAEALIRFLYSEYIKDTKSTGIRRTLEHVANLDDAIGGQKIVMHKSSSNNVWRPQLQDVA